MSTHPTAAEKLLAMLDDGQAIETLDSPEVRADLALLGLDPEPAIAFARALAADHEMPGGRLLGGIGAAEDLEAEVARIESASIDEVRAKIPGGTAAVVAAEARRKAGGGSNVVGIGRRRRSRVLVWGAPAAGLAASLLIIVVGYEVLTVRFKDGPMQYAERAASPPAAESEAPPTAGISSLRDAPAEAPSLESRASESDQAGDGAIAKRARRDAGAPAAAASGNEPHDAFADDRTELEAGDAEKGYFRAEPEPRDQRSEQELQEDPVASPGRNIAESGGAAAGLVAEPAVPAQDRLAESVAGEASAMPRVVAVLVVEDGLVPESIKSQGFPADGLADRLDEARRVAAGRDVVALIALETPGGRTEFVQVLLAPGLSQQLAPPAPIAGLLGADASGYDFIALPAP